MALTSSIWTKNVELGKKIASELESGVTTVNDHLYTHGQSETPWGGWKDSGLGRTHSALGLDEMTQPKLVNWDLVPSKRNIWWYPFDQPTYDGMLSALRMNYPTSFFGWLKDVTVVTKLLLTKMFSPWRAE